MYTDISRVTKEELLALHDQLTIKAHDLMIKKNQDYTGGTDDPFANFRGSTTLGVEPEIGLMIRMTDKMQRVKSFVAHGELAVAEEGIMDIGADLINYAVLLTGMLLEREVQKLNAGTVEPVPSPAEEAAAEADGGFELGDDASDNGPKPATSKNKGGSKK